MECFGIGHAGGVSTRFRTCDLDQAFLHPPSWQHWPPETHLARFIADVTSHFDVRHAKAEVCRYASLALPQCRFCARDLILEDNGRDHRLQFLYTHGNSKPMLWRIP
jgi:hypothetical protein